MLTTDHHRRGFTHADWILGSGMSGFLTSDWLVVEGLHGLQWELQRRKAGAPFPKDPNHRRGTSLIDTKFQGCVVIRACQAVARPPPRKILFCLGRKSSSPLILQFRTKVFDGFLFSWKCRCIQYRQCTLMHRIALLHTFWTRWPADNLSIYLHCCVLLIPALELQKECSSWSGGVLPAQSIVDKAELVVIYGYYSFPLYFAYSVHPTFYENIRWRRDRQSEN